MTDIPELRDGRFEGRLPVGPRRSQPRGPNNPGMDWKTTKVIAAQIVGIAEPIDDNVVGHIPAKTPLTPEQSWRACGMTFSRGRRLQRDPNYQRAYQTALGAFKVGLEPRWLHAALGILEDPEAKDRDRLAAAYFLRGPTPAPGVTVNVDNRQQSLVSPAGYVVRLTEPEAEHRAPTEPKTINATATRGNVGDLAEDAAQERREAHRFRPR